jgi:heme/copper-type cytochrome/quinol oxidase subunit 3
MEELENVHNQSGKAEGRAKQERTYKLIVLLGIGASIRLFGSLISAIVVSSMDGIWVNFPMPSAFYWSTATIIISSITLYLAMVFAKKEDSGKVKLMLALSVILCIVFGVFQFKGFNEMINKNLRMAGQGIYFQQGPYGRDFILTKEGKEISFDGMDYFLEGDSTALEADEVTAMQNFVAPIVGDDAKFIAKSYKLDDYESSFAISIRKNTEIEDYRSLALKDGVLYLGTEPLSLEQASKLFYFAFGVKNETPFFGIKGRYGKDFTVSMNGRKLDFVGRKLYQGSQTLSEEERNDIEATFYSGGKSHKVKGGKVYCEGAEVDLSTFEDAFTYGKEQDQIYIANGTWTKMGKELTFNQMNQFYQANNTASSFLYVITIMHLLHVLLGLGVLVALFIRNQKGLYHSENVVGLKIGGYFWHFLGLLWISLFLFWWSYSI